MELSRFIRPIMTQSWGMGTEPTTSGEPGWAIGTCPKSGSVRKKIRENDWWASNREWPLQWPSQHPAKHPAISLCIRLNLCPDTPCWTFRRSWGGERYTSPHLVRHKGTRIDLILFDPKHTHTHCLRSVCQLGGLWGMEISEKRKGEASAEWIGRSTKGGEENISEKEKGQELESPQAQKLGKWRDRFRKECYLNCVHIWGAENSKEPPKRLHQRGEPGSGSWGEGSARASAKWCDSFTSNDPAPIPFFLNTKSLLFQNHITIKPLFPWGRKKAWEGIESNRCWKLGQSGSPWAEAHMDT